MLTTLPSGYVETPVAAGLNRPTTFEFAPDGRIFVTQQTGEIRVVKDGALLPTPFLSLDVDSDGERGLLGIAFDPNFAVNSHVYAYYTVPGSPAHNRVSRFTANGDVVVPGSEVPIFDIDPLSAATNHNGGAIHFGIDGKLYIGVGDNSQASNAQTLDSLHGKILRINADGSIPDDNPFASTATGLNRAIWALGLRNPYSFAFQPGSSTMFINDVGQSTWEEINDGIAGSNYGWPFTEGVHNNPNFRSPINAYEHGPNNVFGSAITGGVFYNPAQNQFPASSTGDYFFTDLGGKWIHQLDPHTGVVSVLATDLPPMPVSIGIDPAGSLYYLAIGGGLNAGVLNKIEYTAAPEPPQPPDPPQPPEPPTGQAPTVTRDPITVAAFVGGSVTFSVEASGSTPLSYQWQRNGANIPGANGPSLTIPSVSATDLGASFRVVVFNDKGSVVSQPADLVAGSPYARALFKAVFRREPEPVALLSLSQALAQGATPQQVAYALVVSPARHADSVVAAYQATLRRNPDDSEFAAAFNLLNSGTSRETLRASLISSAEYAARVGGTPVTVVRAIYQDLLGRLPRRAELNQGIRSVTVGATSTLVGRLITSNEARTRLIANAYDLYLQRRPTNLEVRTALVQLRRGLTLDQAEATLLSSREFITRSGTA